MRYYLPTPTDGHLFYADRKAEPGAVLAAIDPDPSFEGRGLLVGKTPAAVVKTRQAGWPCAIWEVEVLRPRRPRALGSGLYQVESLRVMYELDVPTVLGAARCSSSFCGRWSICAPTNFMLFPRPKMNGWRRIRSPAAKTRPPTALSNVPAVSSSNLTATRFSICSRRNCGTPVSTPLSSFGL